MRCNYYIMRKGRACKNSAVANSKYCWQHKTRLERPDACIICLNPFTRHDEALPCGHWIHIVDVVQSGQSRCPVCRADITLSARYQKRLIRHQIRLKRYINGYDEEEGEEGEEESDEEM